MKKVKLAFIILQYNEIIETLECINSIKKSLKKREDYSIIVVDNGSNKKNIKKFKEKIIHLDIDFLVLRKNKGFSYGNNKGCSYAKRKYNPLFYYVINNDTLIVQKNLIELIEEEYNQSKFDVLGPDIINSKREHQNPYHPVKNIKLTLKKLRLKLFINFLFLTKLTHWIMVIFNFFKSFIAKSSKKQNLKQRQENVALHGSALIFSKKFFNNVKKPFFPEVFLYSEEDILNYNRILKKLKFVYSPKIKIIHKASRTVNKSNKSKRKAISFKIKNQIKSLKILQEYLKKNLLKIK